MIVLKIIGWILLILIGLFVLTMLMITLALSVKIQIGIDAGGEEGFRFRIKYGFFGLKIFPEMFTEEKIEKYKRIYHKLKRWFGPTISKMTNKFADKIETKIQKSRELKEIEKELEEEENQFKEQQEEFEEEAKSFADTLREFDFYGIYLKLADFKSKFSSETVINLLKYLSRKTGKLLTNVLKHIIIKQLFIGMKVTGNDAADTAIKYGETCIIAFPAMGQIVTKMKVRKYDLDISPDFLARKNSAEIHTLVAFRPILLIMAVMGYFIKVSNKMVLTYMKSKFKKKKKNSKDVEKESKIKLGGA